MAYAHPNKDILFQNITFAVSAGEKCAIVGDNGVGKSTLLKIVAGKLTPSAGSVHCAEAPYMIPQHFGQFDSLSVAEALGMAERLEALSALLEGRGREEDLEVLNDEWDLRERLEQALANWDISHIEPSAPMKSLSGGEKTKVFLAGLDVYKPELVLMDEPTNHLDAKGRALLNEHIAHSNATILIVSHDRALLNRLSSIYEMRSDGMRYYPMNYAAYKQTTDWEHSARLAQLENRQKELVKAERSARKTMERQQKHASRGEKLSAKKCVARIAMGNLQNRAEATASRLDKVQQEKLETMRKDLQALRGSMDEQSAMKLNINSSSMYRNKRLVEMKGVTFNYKGRKTLWETSPLQLQISSGERIRLEGDNGCGKTTLIKLVCGALQPSGGEIWRAENLKVLYLDQEYSCVDDELTVYGQLEACSAGRSEQELKALLNRFLFNASTWDKKCATLSGGEKMKLALCRLLVGRDAPDMLIADEPTNNIDIASMDILSESLKAYKGTLIVVSHDEDFVKNVGISRTISLP